MVDVAQLNLRVQSGDVVKADQRLGRFNQTATRSERASARLAESARKFGRAFAVVGAAAAAAAADSIRLAAAAEETANKFRTVFRGSVAETDRQIIQLSKSIPLTVSELRGLAASTQDLLVPLGLVRSEAADLSVDAVRLAGDLASFNNTGADEALRAIQSALAGSSEPMRRFGVDTRETRLQTLALNEGLIEQGEDLNSAARAQAVFRAITLDSTDAVGDAVATMDSASNASRRLARDLRQVREDLGTALLPAFTALVSELGNTEDGMSDVEAVTRRLFLLIGRLAQGAILAAEGFSTLGRVIALTIGEARFLLEDFADNSQFGEALIGESDEAIEAFERAIAGREAFREAFSEDFTESRAQFQRLFNQLGEGLDDFAEGTQNALKESEELKGGIDALGNQAEETAKQNEKLSKSFADMDSRIADLKAELDGPLTEAIRDFNRETMELERLLADGEITGQQFVTMLGLLEENFVRVRDEIGENLAQTLEEMINSTLPAFIQQMLGIADATDQISGNILNFGRIGSGFAQSIFNGQSIGDSISGALIGAGGQGLSEEFGEIFEDGFKSALDNLGDPETWKPSAEGFALALGQAASGNIGQAAFTAVGNAIGGPIGALVGSILGDALFGGSRPKFQVRGRASSQADDAGTDRLISTAFGVDLEIAFRGIEDTAKRQIVRGYSEFLTALSGVVRDPGQQSAIADVISRFGVSSRSGPDDIEGQLELLFADILGTFDSFTQGFVQQAETLDGQVQRLDDILKLSNLDALGRNFGLTFEELATVLDDVAVGGESIIQTFLRLEGVIASLDAASALTGNSLAESREGLVRFGADLTALFGDDAGALSSKLDRALGAIFSDVEISEQEIAASRQQLSDLLTSLGVQVTEDSFTQDGFRDIFESLFGNLSAEDTATLIEAGSVFADLIEAEEELARIRGDAADGLAEDFRRAVDSIARALDAQLIGPASSLTPQERLNEAESQLRQAVADAQAGDLQAARDIPALFNQAIGLGAGFFGTATEGFAAFESDLRSLLEGLELGGFSVADAQLTQLQEISESSRRQVEILSQIAGGTDAFGGTGDFSAPPSGGKSNSSQIEALNNKIEQLVAKTETANEDRRTAAQAQIDELAAIVEELINQRDRQGRPIIRRPSTDAARPSVVRGRQT